MFSTTSKRKAPAGSGAQNADPQVEKELQRFLRFQLSFSVIGLLPASAVVEIIQIPEEQILPAPQMHPCVMGVYNWRSEMVWMVDLQYLLGYSPTEPTSTEPAVGGLEMTAASLVMIVKHEERTLGLVVPAVEALVDLDMKQIYPPSAELFSGQSFPFLAGYFMSADREIAMLLKPEVIFSLG